MSLAPREHGAYGQLAVPLATALVRCGVDLPAAAIAASLVAFFFAHEPWLVLSGVRGSRARREHGPHARWAWGAAIAVGIAAGLAAVWFTPPPLRWTYVLPLVPALVVVTAVARGRDKSLLAELATATAFALTAVPIGAVRGTLDAGMAIGVTFALVFGVATLAVRSVTAAAHGRDSARRDRVVAIAVSALAVLALSGAAQQDRITWTVPLAVIPGALAALAIAVIQPGARHLPRLGWLIMAAALWATVVLVSGA